MTRQNVTKCISESYYYSLFIRSPCWLDLIIRNIVLLLILNCLPTYLKLIESIETIRIALKIIISIIICIFAYIANSKKFRSFNPGYQFLVREESEGCCKSYEELGLVNSLYKICHFSSQPSANLQITPTVMYRFWLWTNIFIRTFLAALFFSF